MVHNKISLERFFEVGGLCVVRYLPKDAKIVEAHWKFDSPKSVEEFNNLMSLVAIQSTTFIWNKWRYVPILEHKDGVQMFHYLEAFSKVE